MKLSEQLGITDEELEARKLAIRRDYEARERMLHHAGAVDRFYATEPEIPILKPSKTLRELQDQIDDIEMELRKEMAIQAEKINSIIAYLKKSTPKNRQFYSYE